MPGTTTELIKEKLNVVDFIRSYVTLQPAGKNFRGLCPFHREKTPSFSVSPDRQSWHCFGCGIGGDVFSFIMKYENIEFSEALKILAEKAGVELRRTNPAEYKIAGILYDLNEAAKEFFKKQLAQSEVAKTYLKERKLSPEIIEEFELGFAPNDFEALTLHFLNGAADPADLARAGLSFRTERGLQMDRFRGRIMFPIHNHMGKVVGFTGRVLPNYDDGKSGKYVNSPETPIFNKSRLLYGFYKSKEHIRGAGSVYLVEGQMDFLMSYQAGVTHAVASSGTAFTRDHLTALRRLTDKITLSFDNDTAGWAAAERVIDLAKANDFSVQIASCAPFKDPADAAAADPVKFREGVEGARPAMEIYFDRYLPRSESGKGKVDYSKRENITNLRFILSKIAVISSPVEKDHWLSELSRLSTLSREVLTDEMARAAPGHAEDGKEPPEAEGAAGTTQFSRFERLAHKYLASMVQENTFGDALPDFLPDHYAPIYEFLKTGGRTHEDPHADSIIEAILLQSETIAPEEVDFLRRELIREKCRDLRTLLILQIRQAEAVADHETLQILMVKLQEVNQRESS